MRYVERVEYLLKQRDYLHNKIAVIKNAGPLQISLVKSGTNIGVDADMTPDVCDAILEIFINKAKDIKAELEQLDQCMSISQVDRPGIILTPGDREDVALSRFIKMMAHELSKNTHKGGWEGLTLPDLRDMAQSHLEDAATDLYAPNVIAHYVHAANYIMMAVDNLQAATALPEEQECP